MPTDVEVDAAFAVLGGDRDAVKKALSAAENAAYLEKKKHCKHQNSIGSGSICSDGSGHYRWYCRDCGDSFETVYLPRTEPTPLLTIWN